MSLKYFCISKLTSLTAHTPENKTNGWFYIPPIKNKSNETHYFQLPLANTPCKLSYVSDSLQVKNYELIAIPLNGVITILQHIKKLM